MHACTRTHVCLCVPALLSLMNLWHFCLLATDTIGACLMVHYCVCVCVGGWLWVCVRACVLVRVRVRVRVGVGVGVGVRVRVRGRARMCVGVGVGVGVLEWVLPCPHVGVPLI